MIVGNRGRQLSRIRLTVDYDLTPFASAFTPQRQMDQADITMTILRQPGEVDTG